MTKLVVGTRVRWNYTPPYKGRAVTGVIHSVEPGLTYPYRVRWDDCSYRNDDSHGPFAEDQLIPIRPDANELLKEIL